MNVLNHLSNRTASIAVATVLISGLIGAAAPRTSFAAASSSPRGSIWESSLNTSWQWQLTGQIDLSVHAQMYDIDAFDNTASTVATLHSMAAKVVCYISGGTFEDWRPDAGSFSSSVLGNAVAGWAGERWLDVRQLTVLGPIMNARMDMCVQKALTESR